MATPPEPQPEHTPCEAQKALASVEPRANQYAEQVYHAYQIGGCDLPCSDREGINPAYAVIRRNQETNRLCVKTRSVLPWVSYCDDRQAKGKPNPWIAMMNGYFGRVGMYGPGGITAHDLYLWYCDGADSVTHEGRPTRPWDSLEELQKGKYGACLTLLESWVE